MTKAISLCFCLVFIACATGCQRGTVNGTVRNVRGETLGGVVVQVPDGSRQVTTDARGNYRIVPSSRDVSIEFSKTGYAPAQLRLDALSSGEGATAGDISMWQLPESAGVYILQDHRYLETSWAIPSQFFISGGTVVYGTRSEPSLSVQSREPLILCYHTPRYDARLSRLIRAEPIQSAGETNVPEIWTAGGSIDADLVPLDSPQGMLKRLRIDHPLEPGVYAVHWGALEGYTTLENRTFMFEIAESPEDDGSIVSSTDLPPADVPVDAPEEEEVAE